MDQNRRREQYEPDPTTTHRVKIMEPRIVEGKAQPLIALNKTRRPDGMSGRQWRQFRKNHNRHLRSQIAAHAR